MRFTTWVGALLLIGQGFAAWAGDAPKAPVDWNCGKDAVPLLVVGMYHMSNPGQDRFGTQVGDVRTEERQREIAEVRRRLAAFAPTKIAVESPFKGGAAAGQYADYLAGKYELAANETDQIGYALARQLGHKTVFGVDFPMWMDGRVPAEIGTPKPRPEAKKPAEAPPDETPAIYREVQRLIDTAPVLDVLRYINSAEYTRQDGAFYVDNLKPDPYDGELYATSNLLTNWYKRNIRIFTNVYRIAEPGDRVMLLIGSGHNAILRQLAVDSADFCLADVEAYLAP
jgi:hypothetical protein